MMPGDWLLPEGYQHGVTHTAAYWVGAQQDSSPLCEPDYCWEWLNEWPIGPDDPFWLEDQPDDGGGQNHDVGAYVVDSDGESDDDGLDDLAGTTGRFAIIERPTSAVCDGDDSLVNYERTYAWQFRYDTARARYMRRPLRATR